MPRSQRNIVNVDKAKIGRIKSSPVAKNKTKIEKIKPNKKTASPTLWQTGTGSRQSKRLQQQKITESWSGNVQKGRRWPANKAANKMADEDLVKVQPAAENSVNKGKNTEKIAASVPQSPLVNKLTREEKLEILKNFDLEGLYGPCRGISRRSRFERAISFNLRPPPQEIIPLILDSHQDDQQFERCIWDCNKLLRVKLGSPKKML